MPTTLRLQDEYGDQLQVVLVESQNTPHDAMIRTALERRWLDERALWTTERVVRTSVSGIPKFVLLDADGRRVLEGHTNAMTSDLHAAVKEQVELARRARRKPRHESLPKVHAAIDDLDYGRALRGLALAERDEDPQAAAVRVRLEEAVARDLTRTAWLLDHGFPDEGVAWAKHLADELASADGWGDELAALAVRVEQNEVKDEVAAQKRLERLRDQLLKKGPDGGLARRLEKIAADQAGRGVGRRAEALAKLAAE